MKILLIGLALLIPTAGYAAPGSWAADDTGVTLTLRGRVASSNPLRAPTGAALGQELIATVGWRYRILGPTPAGLQVKLCAVARCMAIEGESGQSRGLAGEAANSDLRFVFSVEGKGALNPPLRVISNQVIVNYQ